MCVCVCVCMCVCVCVFEREYMHVYAYCMHKYMHALLTLKKRLTQSGTKDYSTNLLKVE